MTDNNPLTPYHRPSHPTQRSKAAQNPKLASKTPSSPPVHAPVPVQKPKPTAAPPPTCTTANPVADVFAVPVGVTSAAGTVSVTTLSPCGPHESQACVTVAHGTTGVVSDAHPHRVAVSVAQYSVTTRLAGLVAQTVVYVTVVVRVTTSVEAGLLEELAPMAGAGGTTGWMAATSP